MPSKRMGIGRLPLRPRPTHFGHKRFHISPFTCVSLCILAKQRPKLCIAAPVSWKRGAKRQAMLQVKELPQGLLPLEPMEIEAQQTPMFPTVIQQARNNMRKFEHCIVLTRVGNFYELYFDHAETYGPLLGLKVAQKSLKKGTSGPTSISMAGFPFFQLDRYLKVLVQDHQKHVAISEETPNSVSRKVKSEGNLFDRQVRRVVTPGTLIDEHFLSPYEHNYLLAVHVTEGRDIRSATEDSFSTAREIGAKMRAHVGLAWLDLSSGDFFTQEADLPSLSSAIARIGPKEVIVDKNLELVDNCEVLKILAESGHVLTHYEPLVGILPVSEWASMLEDAIPSGEAEKFTLEEKTSASLLLQYAKSQLHDFKMRLQSPIRRTVDDYMGIDKQTLRGLEVTQTLRDGLFRGSLLHAIRRTMTESGARLLQDRLTSPSTSTKVINDRLDLVAEVFHNVLLREDVRSLLCRTSDSLRLVQKFSFGRGDADDLLRLSKTIEITSDLVAILRDFVRAQPAVPSNANAGTMSESCIERLVNRFRLEGPTIIASSIREAIDEEGLSKRQRINDIEAAEVAGMARDVIDGEGPSEDLERLSKRLSAKRFTKPNTDDDLTLDEDEVWIMRRQASDTLDQLHESLRALREEKSSLTAKLREQLGADSLTLKWTPGLGHICHVKGRDTKASLTGLDNARAVSSSKSTRSIHLPEWSRLGGRIDEAKLRIRTEEQRVFQTLRNGVIQNLVPIRRNAALLDELDVACSFAILAAEQNYVRPVLNHSTSHKIVGGRHPTVEVGLASSGRQFTTNDCFVGDSERIWLITGPNMAGKSTFLRQNAIISILAQTGGFVPAEFAEIGIVDQTFSRVGSADNLSADQSTFMIEMLETAHILRNATSRSFVIMDEIGRGTTPEDGIAVGYAALHHLHHVNRCRGLFATHFHGLVDMTKQFDSIGRYCTSVVEDAEGSFTYVHRLQPGVNRDSHALKVAKMAGLPEKAIAVASEVISCLKSRHELREPRMEYASG